MTRDEFHKKMVMFENNLGSANTFNPIYILFPVMFIISFIRNAKKRDLANRIYSELLADIDKINPPLEAKEYKGWKKRIHSAFKE
jgi:hypothetical protein